MQKVAPVPTRVAPSGQRMSGLIRKPAHVASIKALLSPYMESIDFGGNNLSQASKGVVERVLAISNRQPEAAVCRLG